MTKSEQRYQSLTTEEKIQARAKAIRPLFKGVEKEKQKFVEGLLHQLAVCTVTLERIVEEINQGDILEEFSQGSQHFRRENPAIKAYNATVKSFATLTRQLLDLLPPSSGANAGEELMGFVAKAPVGGRK